MDYKFYVIEGDEAQKLIEENKLATKKFHEAREAWELKYAPFLTTDNCNAVASETRLESPMKHGVCKERIIRDKYFYLFSKKTLNPNDKNYPMFQSYQALVRSYPDFTDMVDKATNLDLGSMVFEKARIYTGKAGLRNNNAPGVIFCKKPINEDEKLEQYLPFVREVKESEWLALLGK